MTTMTPEDAIKAASSIARDVADGRLSPTALEDQAVAECRALFGTVGGDGDPLWDVHRDIARQALALGALTADELSEWAAVSRHQAGEAVATPDPSDTPPDPVPFVSVAHGPETVPSDDTDDGAVDIHPDGGPGAVDLDDVGGAEPAVVSIVGMVPTSPRPDHYDPTAAWLAGGTRRN
ncbi:hypothetical protein [Mycobacterium sp. IS-1556]|uniref:hypothetical protein n=1 Tax=Mycobacterium sp. IS-1556 TaxID=1772276 RepID=UPI000741548D|nr:hypothetical protein [Mycobacterium sp. IS-1556]KUH86308.1 flagellar hook-length control protein [Mycobacterium sp. IS-1556]